MLAQVHSSSNAIVKCQPTDDIATFVNAGVIQPARYQREQEQMINSLYRNVAPIELKNKDNQDDLNRIMQNVSMIPHIELPALELNSSVFEAEPIRIEKDDTKEIKALIVKINKKVACHTCDHTGLEKLKLNYANDIIELRKSVNLNKVYDYYDQMRRCCVALSQLETNERYVEKGYTLNSKFLDRSNWVYDELKLKEVQQAAVNFGQEILKLKSKYLRDHCHKCEKLQKEYAFAISEIQRLRDEVRAEQEEAIKQIEYKEEPITDFMNEHFKDKQRLKVGDITKLWKTLKRVMITQGEIAIKLEETGKWKISTVHHVMFATRI